MDTSAGKIVGRAEFTGAAVYVPVIVVSELAVAVAVTVLRRAGRL